MIEIGHGATLYNNEVMPHTVLIHVVGFVQTPGH